MSLEKLLKFLPYLKKLRRLTPVGIIMLLFSAPALLFLEDFPGSNSTPKTITPPVTQSTPGSGVSIDPFAHSGAFAIRQADADRASWSWDRAKRLSVKVWKTQTGNSDTLSGFYCGCSITRRGSTGGEVDFNSCGYTPRVSASRASRLEWEHIVPAAFIGRGRSCWMSGAPQCIDKSGQAFKGRSCCMIADPAFAMAATDPVNLVPSVGEVNGDRLDYFFGLIAGEKREYGQCNMEIDRTARLAEPPENRRGDIARIWAYMSKAYGLSLPRETAVLYSDWIASDPVSAEEIRINQSILKEGHRPNPFVLGDQR
jgi:deoxyribonuclease-1